MSNKIINIVEYSDTKNDILKIKFGRDSNVSFISSISSEETDRVVLSEKNIVIIDFCDRDNNPISVISSESINFWLDDFVVIENEIFKVFYASFKVVKENTYCVMVLDNIDVL